MPEEWIILDARRTRGIFLVVTENKTRYWLTVDKRVSGYMRAIADKSLRGLQTGVVGGESCCPEPIVRVGDSMHLVAARRHIVRTGLVKSITPTDIHPEMLACQRCSAYRPQEAARCLVCRY